MMRAKLKVTSVVPFADGGGENLTFSAVGKSESYPEDGSDENNTFAKFTPNASLSITIMNPALFGKFEAGQEFYADFTPAD